MGDVGIGSFHHDRERLIEGVGRQAQRVIETYDRAGEAASIAEGTRNTVAALAAVEVGAVGLGTLVTILATTASADATGVLLASLVAILGLFVIPARRRKAKQDMREKIASMRERLITALRSQFEAEMARSLQKINEAIAPYTRFIRAERSKLETMTTSLEGVQTGLESLRVRVEDLEKM